MGPGTYNPNKISRTRYSGADWHSSKVEQCSSFKQINLSNEDQIIDTKPIDKKYKKNNSSVFSSMVPKLGYLVDIIKLQKQMPGPGQYTIRNNVYKKITNFKNKPTKPRITIGKIEIGPGSYDVTPQHYSPRSIYKAPFESTQVRFKDYLHTIPSINPKININSMNLITMNYVKRNEKNNVSSKHVNKLIEVFKNITTKKFNN